MRTGNSKLLRRNQSVCCCKNFSASFHAIRWGKVSKALPGLFNLRLILRERELFRNSQTSVRGLESSKNSKVSNFVERKILKALAYISLREYGLEKMQICAGQILDQCHQTDRLPPIQKELFPLGLRSNRCPFH